MKKTLLGLGFVLAFFVLIAAIIVAAGIGYYNSFVAKDQKVQEAWAQVENVYQRRADLIPNLVETVKGYAKHERETFTLVTEARAKVGQIKIDAQNLNPEILAQFQGAQDSLGSAIGRLLVVLEKYPELKANENFLGLQAQLEGTENRITVERKRFNEVAQDYNTAIKKVPGLLIANMFGFKDKPYFKAEEGAEKAPKVKFD